MFKHIAVALMIAGASHAAAAEYAEQEVSVRYIINYADPHIDVKGLSLAHYLHADPLVFKTEAGVLSSAGNFTGFIFGGAGVQPTYGPIFVYFIQSVGLVNNPDGSYLSGNFQFSEDVGVGFRDKNNNTSIGLGFKHISNAGIVAPNNGRDLLNLEIRLPL